MTEGIRNSAIIAKNYRTGLHYITFAPSYIKHINNGIYLHDVLIPGSRLFKPKAFDHNDNNKQHLFAPFQRCLRGKDGKEKFQNSCLPGSLHFLSLMNEPRNIKEKRFPVTGATGNTFPKVVSDKGEDVPKVLALKRDGN
jgi:hypothetical protein